MAGGKSPWGRRVVRLLVATAPLLSSCGGGGGDGSSAAPSGSAVPVVPAPAPTPAPAPAPGPAPSPTPAPSPAPALAGGFAAQAAALYDRQPNPAACDAGALKAAVRAEMLARVNAVRALHGLAAVTYSGAETDEQAASSLMMAANRSLSHAPPADWTCYSAGGARGAGASNLIGGWGNGLSFQTEDDYVATWLNEGGSASIGHRRWILDPFLGKLSYGRVAYQSATGDRASAGSLRVFNFAGAAGAAGAPATVPGFVAYPSGDYPARYFRPADYLSFTAVADRGGTSGANARVSFAAATVTVSGPSGALAVTDLTYDNNGYGTANNLQWRVTGLAAGVTYTVRIAGVTGAPQAGYTYTFRIG